MLNSCDRMKRILTILAIALAIAIEAEAQSIRLGDRIPDMQLDRELAITSKEYVCLSFVHTESAPCLLAIETLCRVVSDYTDHIEIVFVSNQEDEITEENCQYKLQKDSWYITGFGATW